MPAILNITQGDFVVAFKRFLESREVATDKVGGVVTDIIRQVRAEGDVALLRLTTQFDHYEATVETIKVSPQEIA